MTTTQEKQMVATVKNYAAQIRLADKLRGEKNYRDAATAVDKAAVYRQDLAGYVRELESQATDRV